MNLADLSAESVILLALPALLNMWAIWHAFKHRFPGERERIFWMIGAIFLPLIGGLTYLIFGFRRSMPMQQNTEPHEDTHHEDSK